MIINKIRIQEQHPMASDTDTWPLPFCDLHLDSSAGENGYILKDSLGLDPPDLISFVDGFDVDGVSVMDSAPEKREIVLKIGLDPRIGQSYSALRDNFYRLISRKVLVKYMLDSLVIAQADGHIKRCEALHHSNQPEILLTIECEDGVFKAPSKVDIPLTTLDTLTPVINYTEGTAPCGLDLQFTYTAVANGTGFTITNHARFWYVGSETVNNEFTVSFPFETDDIVVMSTHPKQRRLTLLRDTVLYDIAGYINAGAVWPKLYPGVNAFEWTFEDTWMTWDAASYIPRWWGV